MKSARGGQVAFGMVVFFWLGAIAVFAAWQLQMVAGPAQPTPQTLSAAELIDKGPGDNLHVELTDFTFGQPAIEKTDNVWLRVWVPVQPDFPGTKPAERTLLLRADGVSNQAQLDELLRQSRLTVLVTNPLHALSIWKVNPTDDLPKAAPKLNLARVTFLVDADLKYGDTVYLSARQAFDPTTGQVAWVVAAVLLSVGFFFLLLVFLNSRGGWIAVPPEQQPPGTEYERQRLAVELPMSTHWQEAGGFLFNVVLNVIGAAFLFLLSMLAVMVAAVLLKVMPPVAPAVVLGISFLILFGVWAVVRRVQKLAASLVSEMSLCPSGLRWKVGDVQQMALWTDLQSIRIHEWVTTRRGAEVAWSARCRLTFRSGAGMELWSWMLSDFRTFIHNAHNRTNDVNQAARSQGGRQFLPR